MTSLIGKVFDVLSHIVVTINIIYAVILGFNDNYEKATYLLAIALVIITSFVYRVALEIQEAQNG